MERYFNAGYCLIKKHPMDLGYNRGMAVSTCSACINTIAFGSWCYGWMGSLDEKEKIELGLDEDSITLIHKWTNEKSNSGILKFGNVLPDLKTAKEFKDLFYKARMDIDLFSLEFSETETNFLLEDFTPGKNVKINYNNGEFGLREHLLHKNDATDDAISDFIGYDFIGVEGDGSFHSFHCHDITPELSKRFGLTINKNGLFDTIIDQKSVRDYLNDKKTAVEPLPWYIVKVKLIRNTSS